MGYTEIDANTFASWDVDYIKLDGCNADGHQLDEGYPAFGKALNATGRSIVYSCEWPLYTAANYTAVRESCNLWRNWRDIEPYWASLIFTIDHYDKNEATFAKFTGPGGWNDPDMLVIGHPGLSLDQAKVQMAIWSIWSAPLIMSVDLRFIAEEYKQILLNKKVIAVDQDPLGIMGRLLYKAQNINVYVKPMTPLDQSTGDPSFAIAFLNHGFFRKASITVGLAQLGMQHAKGYVIENLFDNVPNIILGPKDSFNTTVNSTGVVMYKATIIV